MNKNAQTISNRLSLRKPQEESLEILQNILDDIKLSKNPNLVLDLDKVKEKYPIFKDFERDFPSLCFALATGVGKTRLMGAFISYLYIEKGIKNFFVLAPNLTIYNKLREDFVNISHPKYVFRGIAEFATNSPRIITGENYNQTRNITLDESPITIHIFNISKINSEVRGGREPKIKRLSEYIGDSYFNYLANLPDLVLLMDESHHYRADAGMKAISELKPILGLELTATPIDKNGTKFKNVVYDYPLARAINDNFVKIPAIATRKDFDPKQYNEKELDILKLKDGLSIHESTKIELEIYSRNFKVKYVKPFVLIVAKDTEHAKEIRNLIESDEFFEGRYKGKVMEVHSKQNKQETEENIQKLISLESPDNNIEIVVHVNMLKEGWDVTNLYTIIPLRASKAQILTEQTIGRGLRLPYGKRTGHDKVDTLTVIAHESFRAIIDEANKPDSIIRKENIIEIKPDEFSNLQKVIVSIPLAKSKIKEDTHTYNSETEDMIYQVFSQPNENIKNIDDLKKASVQESILQEITSRIESTEQQNMFKDTIVEEISKNLNSFINDYVEKTIAIPRVTIIQSEEIVRGFRDFDLEVKNFNPQPVSEEILIRTLGINFSQRTLGSSENYIIEKLDNLIVSELINYPEIDYDHDQTLIYKLTNQALTKITAGRSISDIQNIVQSQKKNIADFIFTQMKEHFYVQQSEYNQNEVLPFTSLEQHNISMNDNDNYRHYTETIIPTNTVPSKIFIGFKKACHSCYKFQSKSEKDFATTLETDNEVLKWLRPAQNQFHIYWDNNSKNYIPDFVVETEKYIYMIEIKAENEIDNDEVQQKATAGRKYCEIVSEYNLKNGGKAWKYVIIPHDDIIFNMSFNNLIVNNI